jgi:hypothetical protein
MVRGYNICPREFGIAIEHVRFISDHCNTVNQQLTKYIHNSVSRPASQKNDCLTTNENPKLITSQAKRMDSGFLDVPDSNILTQSNLQNFDLASNNMKLFSEHGNPEFQSAVSESLGNNLNYVRKNDIPCSNGYESKECMTSSPIDSNLNRKLHTHQQKEKLSSLNHKSTNQLQENAVEDSASSKNPTSRMRPACANGSRNPASQSTNIAHFDYEIVHSFLIELERDTRLLGRLDEFWYLRYRPCGLTEIVDTLKAPRTGNSKSFFVKDVRTNQVL